MKTRMTDWRRRPARFFRCLIWGILLLSIGGLGLTGIQLYQTYQVAAIGQQHYQALAEAVTVVPAVPAETGEAVTSDAPSAWRPDLAKLQALYGDAIAWLDAPGTALSYPVMRATDYAYYLRHFPDGTYNLNGTPFLDYHCAPDFSDRLNIIYGHNMETGNMFGSLEGYKDPRYAAAHPTLYLYTPQQDYRIEVLYGCVMAAGEWRARAFMYEVNLASFLAYGQAHTTFTTEVTVTEQDQLLVLSTCSYEFDDARYVLMGVMRPFKR